MIRKLILLAALMFTLFLPSFAPIAWSADEPKLEVSASDAVKSNLEKMVGKAVTLKLSSGEEITGKVANVGPNAVQLSQLSGREFFDAVVPFEKIEALIARTRTS